MPIMNGAKVMEQHSYELSSDFTAEDGTPAAWAPNMPSHWGLESNKLLLDCKPNIYNALDLSGDDSLLAVVLGKSIYIFSVADLQLREELVGHTEDIQTVIFAVKHHAGHTLISSTSNTVIFWELNDKGEDLNAKEAIDTDDIAQSALESVLRELKCEFVSEASNSLTSDFKIGLAAAGAQKGLKNKTVLKGSLGNFGSDVFSRDGEYMFTLSNDSTQQGMREEDLLPCIEVRNAETKEVIHRLKGHTDAVMWIGASPDSKKLATVAWDGTVRIWSLRSGFCLHTFGSFGGQMWAGAWSPNSQYLAFTQNSPKTIIYVYNSETAEEVSKYTGIKSWARSIAWSPDGKYVASGSQNAAVVVYDPMTGEKKKKWEHKFGIENERMMKGYLATDCVQFVGSKLIFKTTEGTIELYDFNRNLKSQFTGGPEDKVDSTVCDGLKVSHDGSFLVSVDADKAVRFWKL